MDFILSILCGLGFMLIIFGAGYLGMTVTEKVEQANKRRTERLNRLLTALERIEVNTRKSADS